jgi:polyhydroxyalkanoate synthesis regulator phasin
MEFKSEVWRVWNQYGEYEDKVTKEVDDRVTILNFTLQSAIDELSKVIKNLHERVKTLENEVKELKKS